MHAQLEYHGRAATFLDCDPNDCIQNYLLQGHWYEAGLLDILAHLEADGNYLDIGAYIGTFSVFAGLFCPATKIYAFEPQADIFAKLRANLAANGIAHCETLNVALADREGTGRMTYGGTNRGGSTLQPGDEIAVAPLDSFGLQNVRVAKIDVEGSELAVLRGGLKTISGVEHLFIEYWPEKTCRAYGIPHTAPYLADLLHGMGFLHQAELPGDSHYWRKPS